MSRIPLIASCLITASLTAGCATSGPTPSVPSSFVGAPVSAFTAQYGAASDAQPLADGRTIAQFVIPDSRTAPRSTGGNYTPRWEEPRVPNGIENQFVGSAHGASGEGVSIDTEGRRYQQCTFTVTVDANGLVEAVATDQDTCNHITR